MNNFMMKKLLGIVVLGLGLVLFSENAYAGNTSACLSNCYCHGYSGVGGPCYDGVGGPCYGGVGGTGKSCPKICNCNLL